MSDSFVLTCLDVLSPVGPVRARGMFGGHGIYREDRMFALIANDTLFLKADEQTRAAFEEAGSTPFVYQGRSDRPVTVSYWEMPPEGFESPEVAEHWALLAVAAAGRSTKRPRRVSKNS